MSTRLPKLPCSNPEWVTKWVQRYREGKIEALADLLRSGRPPVIPQCDMDCIMKDAIQNKTTPVMLQQKIQQDYGVSYHITHVRNIMRRYNMSPKVSQLLHINHATVSQVRNWQYRLNEAISCLKSDGFTVCVMGEAIFIHDSMRGRKYWSPIGTRIITPYIRNHKRIIVYGVITDDGRQTFRTHEKFNGDVFYDYVIQLHRKWGKIDILCDRASSHKTHKIKRLLRNNKSIRIIYLPRGSPYLNAVEACWHIGKRELLVSEYYSTFTAMCNAISKYYRTVRFKLDLFTYLYRSPLKILTNFVS